jgi:hypothetical protein
VNGDTSAAYVAIAFVGLLGGYNLYAILLLYVQRRKPGTPVFTAREVVYFGALLVCGAMVVAGCTALASTAMVRFSLSLGSAVLLGAAIRHFGIYRRVFTHRK